MNSRTVALLMTLAAGATAAAAGLGRGQSGAAMAAALLVLAGGWLTTGVVRRLLAAAGLAVWVVVLVSAVGAGWWSLASAILGLSGALIVLVAGGRWPGWSSRYDRSGGAAPPDDPRQMWDSLDRGVDPTLDK